MTDAAGIPGDRIRSFIERIEHIDDEIKALNEGRKEVFAEAKGEGFDVKVLRETCGCASRTRTSAKQNLLDLYLRAMESAGSSQAKAAWRQAAIRTFGCSHCTTRVRGRSALQGHGVPGGTG